jgi:hypothetical protein
MALEPIMVAKAIALKTIERARNLGVLGASPNCVVITTGIVIDCAGKW